MPVTLDTGGDGLTAQGQAVIQAVGLGELIPFEGASFLQGLSAQARIINVDEIERRLAALEEQR